MKVSMVIIQLMYLVSFLTMSSCGMLARTTKPKEDEVVVKPLEFDGKRTFRDCAEINKYLQTSQGYCGTPNKPCPIGVSRSPSVENDLSKIRSQWAQENYIDESDVVKVSDDFIFVSRFKSVAVIDRVSSVELGSIGLTGQSQSEMYIHDKALILIEQVNDSIQIRSYELKPHQMPLLKIMKTIAGRIKETRVQKNELLVISTHILQFPVQEANDAIGGIKCSEIIVPFLKESEVQAGFLPVNPNSLFRVSSLDLNDEFKVKSSMALLDHFRNVYVTDNNIILAKDLSEKDVSNKTESTLCSMTTYGCSCNDGTRFYDATHLAVLARDQNNSTFQFAGAGEILGRVPNKWALKQFSRKNEFFAGTTTHKSDGFIGSRMTSQVYRIEINGQNLSVKGQVNDLAANEEIRAMQYVDGFAYVVTYKKTDPLFVLDLKSPDAPKKVGEVLVPGFSSMLYSLSADTLLGVGFDTVDVTSGSDFSQVAGIQFSLFDVSNKLSPKLASFKVHGDWGSASESTSNAHALYHDPESQIIASSIVEFEKYLDGESLRSGTLKSSGSVFYRYKDNELREIARVTHEDLMPERCKNARQDWFSYWWGTTNESFDVRRIFKIEDKIYTISPFGIKIHSNELLTEERTILFANSEATCSDLLEYKK